MSSATTLASRSRRESRHGVSIAGSPLSPTAPSQSSHSNNSHSHTLNSMQSPGMGALSYAGSQSPRSARSISSSYESSSSLYRQQQQSSTMQPMGASTGQQYYSQNHSSQPAIGTSSTSDYSSTATASHLLLSQQQQQSSVIPPSLSSSASLTPSSSSSAAIMMATTSSNSSQQNVYGTGSHGTFPTTHIQYTGSNSSGITTMPNGAVAMHPGSAFCRAQNKMEQPPQVGLSSKCRITLDDAVAVNVSICSICTIQNTRIDAVLFF
ncbi:hypothetical protein BDF19DRAFT_104451 [Syncephalis fuscata]|nr:hypothetical protein BDF19DRAFT_104451 [Syncephalis fuscata]